MKISYKSRSWLERNSIPDKELDPYKVNYLDKFGSKMQMIFSTVEMIFKTDATAKIIFFCQWKELLDLLMDAAQAYGHLALATLRKKIGAGTVILINVIKSRAHCMLQCILSCEFCQQVFRNWIIGMETHK